MATSAFSGTDSRDLLDHCRESQRVIRTFNDMGEHGWHCNCMADDTIVRGDVYCEASASSAEILADIPLGWLRTIAGTLAQSAAAF